MRCVYRGQFKTEDNECKIIFILYSVDLLHFSNQWTKHRTIKFGPTEIRIGKVFVSPDTADPTPDQYPQYPGGVTGLMADIGKLIKYPERDRLKEKEGTVILKYIIEKDGTISEIEVEQRCQLRN